MPADATRSALPTRARATTSVFAWILVGILACGAEPDTGPGASDESAPPVVRRPNIVVYLVDTLRRDHLGTYGYSRDTSPRLTAFAADAVRFDNAYTPSSWTRPAVASLLTGLAPASHGVSTRLDKVPQRVRMAGEYLSAAGYRTAAVVTNPNVLPIWGFQRGFERFTDVESETKAGRADDVIEAASLYLRERADAAGRTEGASRTASPVLPVPPHHGSPRTVRAAGPLRQPVAGDPDSRGRKSLCQSASLVDLLSTVLAVLGETIPDDLDGRNLMTAIESGSNSELTPDRRRLDFELLLAAREPTGGSHGRSGPVAALGVVAKSRGELSDLPDQSVRRLQALGYME